MRKISSFKIDETNSIYQKLLNWLAEEQYFSLYQGNNYKPLFGSFDNFAAAGAIDVLTDFTDDPFGALKAFHRKNKDWVLGRFSYDIKNYVENLSSRNANRLKSPEMAFFIPETLIFFNDEEIIISSHKNPGLIWDEIKATSEEMTKSQFPILIPDTSKSEYIQNVNLIREHIIEGDFYELNYCMEYYCHMVNPGLAALYYHLNKISPMPFSNFQGIEGDYIISASPERFLKKEGDKIIAQPIKGTTRKDHDPIKDSMLIEKLRTSEKERAENMMIMDLMRNDLAKSAITGSVEVPELFEIYSFNHLHQMISTVTASLKPELHFTEVIKNAFPMGSMTGAPKIKAMEMIEVFEKSARGNFSGAAGYIKPNGDFDFNVLIRSYFYNKKTSMLACKVGSAITYDALPEDEYNECVLKASAMFEAIKACTII